MTPCEKTEQLSALAPAPGWAPPQRWFVNAWASCGHRLTVRDGPNKDGNSWSVRYADYDREGGRSAIYASVCNKCYGRMRARGALLTHEQVEEWLMNGNLPALPNVAISQPGQAAP